MPTTLTHTLLPEKAGGRRKRRKEEGKKKLHLVLFSYVLSHLPRTQGAG